jgi:Ca2+:H+ antiporter
MTPSTMVHIFRQEARLIGALAITLAVYAFPRTYLEHGQWAALLASALLVCVILAVSLSVAGHAELLARKVGDPYGTMILTLSSVTVEVVVLGVVMMGTTSAVLARDSIYSAVMLDINGTLGLAALMGGFKHGEQAYNDDSARVYTVMILTAMGVAMMAPAFVPAALRPWYGACTIVTLLVLYGVFLRMQVGPHSYFFSYSYEDKQRRRRPPPSNDVSRTHSIVVMILGVALVSALAEVLSGTLDRGLAGTHAPATLMALVIAVVSAGPEILTALRASLANRMQPAVNIALGASLSTVTLTVPAMTVLALAAAHPIDMALTPIQMFMSMLTLVVAAINLNDGATNAIEGMTHFALFLTFLIFLVLGV